MAIPISSFDDFLAKFQERKSRSDLFSFFLFDKRPDHTAIATFISDQFGWLDELAWASRTFVFLFSPVGPHGRRSSWRVRNPGLKVAQMFGIRPNQLPGVVVFCLDDGNENVAGGTFYPLDAAKFEQEPESARRIIADLYSMIQECTESDKPAIEKLKELEEMITSHARSERVKPFVAALKSGCMTLARLPVKLLTEMARGFGSGLAGQLDT